MTINVFVTGIIAVIAGLSGTATVCGVNAINGVLSEVYGQPRPATRLRLRTTRLHLLLAYASAAMVTGAIVAVGFSLTGAAIGTFPLLKNAVAVIGLVLLAGRELAWWRFKVPDLNLIVPKQLVATTPLRHSIIWGAALGAGFLTLIQYGAWWGFQLSVFILADPFLGIVLGAVYGLSRCAPAIALWFSEYLQARWLVEGGHKLFSVGRPLGRAGGVAMIIAAVLFAYEAVGTW